jgi:ABC-type uncharacterized transport system substrate-binding protein
MRFGEWSAAVVVAALLACSAEAVAGNDVVAVLSSELQPYRQALQGMQEELGAPVPVLDATALPADVRVVVTFGSKAAMQSFPDRAALVICMAPGLRSQDVPHPGAKFGVQMSPPAEVICAHFKDLQPRLARLGVLWTSAPVGEYLDAARPAVSRLGIELVAERLPDPSDLPARLRSWSRRVDAVWLPPDPPMVSERTFAIVKEFADANAVPFFAPTEGLVSKGAFAAVAGNFRDIGRTAARAVRQVLAGEATAAEFFPPNGQVTVNVTTAERISVEIPPEVLRRVDRVVR